MDNKSFGKLPAQPEVNPKANVRAIWSEVATPDCLLGFPAVFDKFSVLSNNFSSFDSDNMNSFLVSPMSFTEPVTSSV